MKKVRFSKIINYIVIILATIIYGSLIFNDSVWSDEAYTMELLKKNYIDIVKETAIDVHPPLYYLIAKTFTIIFGYSVPVVKFVSILPIILIMLIVTIKSKKLFEENSEKISLIFNLLIAFIPIAFTMNIELRMYTWCMFFCTCSGIYAYEIYKDSKKKSNIILFIIFSLCAAYTHYFAAITAFVIYVFLSLSLIIKDKKNWKLCILLVVLTIIGYLPWIPVLLGQVTTVKGDYWIQGIGILSDIQYLFGEQFTNIFLALFACIIVGLSRYIINNKKDSEAKFAFISILVLLGTVFIGYALSVLIRPIFVNRYMYGAVGLLFLGISIACTKLEYKTIIIDALIGLLLINLPFSYVESYKKEYENGTEEFKTFISENVKESDQVSTDIAQFTWSMLKYYMPGYTINDGIDKDTRGYVITKKNLKEIKNMIPDAKINQVFKGDIDNTYEFTIYYAE